jgi:hypothetical protein
MAVDGKYGRVSVEREPGNPLGEDEPVFVLRARDLAAVGTLLLYEEAAFQQGAGEEHLAAVEEARAAFARWRHAHPELMKVPD